MGFWRLSLALWKPRCLTFFQETGTYSGDRRLDRAAHRAKAVERGQGCAPPARSSMLGQLWGQPAFTESPGSSIYAGFRAEAGVATSTNKRKEAALAVSLSTGEHWSRLAPIAPGPTTVQGDIQTEFLLGEISCQRAK